jgi:hypothetical protein
MCAYRLRIFVDSCNHPGVYCSQDSGESEGEIASPILVIDIGGEHGAVACALRA